MLCRNAMRVTLCVLACGMLTGCAVDKEFAASALSALQRPAALRQDTRQYTDNDVLVAFSRQAQLKFPAKLAVYESTSQSSDYDIRDNETIDTIFEAMTDEEKFYQTVVLTPTFIDGAVTPLNLRRAAAEHRADLTLLCESDFKVEVDAGILTVFDLTILGAFLVPSRTIEIESRVTAHLIDTRNGLIYHSVLKKKSWKGRSPAAWGKETVETHRKELANENYKEVAEDLKKNLEHAERLARQPTPTVSTLAPLPPVRRSSPGLRRLSAPRPAGTRYETRENDE